MIHSCTHFRAYCARDTISFLRNLKTFPISLKRQSFSGIVKGPKSLNFLLEPLLSKKYSNARAMILKKFDLKAKRAAYTLWTCWRKR